MENLFEDISGKCKNKSVQNLCKKLSKKLSFKSGKDVENLCHLSYWLYILGEKELAKKCINLTADVPFDQNYNVWDFINNIWGLGIRIFREEGKNKDAEEIIKKMDKNYLIPRKQFNETTEQILAHEKKRRSRYDLDESSYHEEIEECLNDNDIKGANEWRFIALLSLIGDTETGLYPKLNENKSKIESIIKNYIGEIIK